MIGTNTDVESGWLQSMEIRLLGSVTAHHEGRRLDLGRRQERCLLGLLLLEAGRVVTIDRLLDLLWAGSPPASARATVHTYVARLRSRLHPYGSRLVTRGGGYLAEVDREMVDVHRFADAVATARELTDPAERVRLLTGALELWQGPLLADVADDRLRERLGGELAELRLCALEMRAEAELDRGHYHQLGVDLPGLVRQYPTRERLAELLMTALYRQGRHAEALDVYRHVRQLLVDELGVEPGPALQSLQRRVLRKDPALLATGSRPGPANVVPADSSPPAGGTVATGDRWVPAQLPADVHGFAGRTDQLAALDALLDAERQPRSTVIVAVTGGGGVGKTTLALHWAHQVADRFPDGQLYSNLGGYRPSVSATRPEQALRGLLIALGIASDRIPDSLDAQVGLYRSCLAGRRVLVVLDDAFDAAQVRPLLPGSPGCLALVTSRNQLSGLAAAQAAHLMPVQVLTPDESRLMLSHRLGEARVAADPDAAQEIVTRTAGLPLALAVVSARAGAHPGFPLAAIAGELRDAQTTLDALRSGEEATDLRAVFSCSYRHVGAPAARMFRLLSVHPGPDISFAAAASLAGNDVPTSRALLVELTRAHLITEHVPSRYQVHDLLRAYAADLAERLDTDGDRKAAVQRVLDHYLHTAYGGVRNVLPSLWNFPPIAPAEPTVPAEPLDDATQTVAWFDAERPVLLALVTSGRLETPHDWQLAWVLNGFFAMRGHYHDWVTIQQAALRAAQRLENRLGQAHAHHGLGVAYLRLDRRDEAHTQLCRAIDLYGQLAEDLSHAHARMTVASVCLWQGRHGEALRHAEQGRDLFQTAGYDIEYARAVNSVGWHHAHQGEYATALTLCQQALALQRDSGDLGGLASTWDSLGYVHLRLGDWDAAIACYEQVLRIDAPGRDGYHTAGSLDCLGDAYHGAGRIDAAHAAWREAAAIYDELQVPLADALRAKTASGVSGLDTRHVPTAA
jgi:DNA-binding SARP family transcriptional activator/tetratricopeptide (TPR) repeat protein